MKGLILKWFKYQAARAARKVLIGHYRCKEVEEILHAYWMEYQHLKPEVPAMPTLGGYVTVNLAAMSTAFYRQYCRRCK